MLATLALLRGNNTQCTQSCISSDAQRTAILHAVQGGIQSTTIEKLEDDIHVNETDLPADDTALYRLSGWACTDNTTKLLKKKETCTHVQEQLELLSALKRPNTAKISLPVGAQYLDRGGLTFMRSCLLPWLKAVEESVKVFLNHNGYTKYGKDIFQVRLCCFDLVAYMYNMQSCSCCRSPKTVW